MRSFSSRLCSYKNYLYHTVGFVHKTYLKILNIFSAFLSEIIARASFTIRFALQCVSVKYLSLLKVLNNSIVFAYHIIIIIILAVVVRFESSIIFCFVEFGSSFRYGLFNAGFLKTFAANTIIALFAVEPFLKTFAEIVSKF